MGFKRTRGHHISGTEWGADTAERYAKAKHGPDGALFLDPYFQKELQNVEGKRIIDVGAGAGPWAVLMAQNGAERVVALDYNFAMVEQAVKAAKDNLTSDVISLEQANAGAIPHPDQTFDMAISINVGCNLPELKAHFTEMYRVLKPGGEVVVTAPGSFDVLFTDGQTNPEQVKAQLEKIFKDTNIEPRKGLNKIEHVLRGTFIVQNGVPELVEKDTDLVPGQAIFRRIPGLTVPNYYHSPQEYLAVAQEAGFKVVSNAQPSFESEEEREEYNQSVPAEQRLGPEYVKSPPFATFVFKKPVEVETN
jgi:SAM-dependent methyltransferase